MEKHLEEHHEKTFKAVMAFFIIFFLAGAVYRVTYSAGPGGPPYNSSDGEFEGKLIVVGAGGVIYHYADGNWTQQESPTPYDLRDVACTAPDNCFAVDKKGIIIHYDGNGWYIAYQADYQSFNGVGCSPNGACHAVSREGYVYTNDGRRYDSWYQSGYLSATTHSVACPTDDRCYSTVDYAAIHGTLNGQWYQYDHSNYAGAFYDLYCTDINHCIAVGERAYIMWYEYGRIEKTTPYGLEGDVFYSIDCVDGECIVVGKGRGAFWIDRTGHIESKPTGDYTYRSVACFAEDNCWMVGDGGAVATYTGSVKTQPHLGDVTLYGIEAV